MAIMQAIEITKVTSKEWVKKKISTGGGGWGSVDFGEKKRRKGTEKRD